MKPKMISWAMLLYGSPGSEHGFEIFKLEGKLTEEDAYADKLRPVSAHRDSPSPMNQDFHPPSERKYGGSLPKENPRVWRQHRIGMCAGCAGVKNDMDWMSGEREEGPPDMPRGEFRHGNYVEDDLIDQLDKKLALEKQGLNPEEVTGTFEIVAEISYRRGSSIKTEFDIVMFPDSSLFDEVEDYCHRICKATLLRFTYCRKTVHNQAACKKAA